ncbi:MAG: tripartite tricarboxylate transporter TctB family protein [Granulosicoccus sp.]
MEHRQDIVLGMLFACLGAVAVWLSTAYSGASGLYPLVLSLIMMTLGVVIVARASRVKEHTARNLVSAPINLVLTIVVLIVYVGLIRPLGFYSASLLLVIALPLLLGFRRPVYLGIMAITFISILFIVFSLVLEKPLPAEIWSSARWGGK